MKTLLGTNWMTSLAGLISAVASGVIFLNSQGYYEFPKVVVGICMFAVVGGLASLGIVAKQYNVTGGTVPQPSTPEALQGANVAPSPSHPPQPKP